MPEFVCEACGCVDNSACGGTYWTRGTKAFAGEAQDKLLCVACTPSEFSDGTPYTRGGKWHGRFPRRMPDGTPFAETPDKEA